ncbi:MSCRAMM family protein [Limimonas halophila]|nr:hypothetical protein [Limimonas halophila]
MADALDFVIEVEPDNAFAEGWFLAKDRTVSFDAKAGEIVREGKRFEVGRDAFLTDQLATRGELYVARQALNKAWPVDLQVDMAQLRVSVNPAEPLPVQKQREREERRERLLSRRGPPEKDLEPVSVPYETWSDPAVDLNSEVSVDQGRTVANHEIDWSQDLLGMSSSGRVRLRTDSTREVTDARLTFRRSDIVEPLPFGVEDVQFGDVSRRALTRVGGLGRGRGITISGFPLERAEQFDTTTVEGNAPTGFEAELYRNGQLLEFQRIGDDGRYEFENVPLLFGNNRLRVVLYGPQGQKRERVRSINTSRALARPGQTIARASLVDVGSDFIPVGEETREDRAGLSATGIVAHGFSKRLSGFGAFTSVPTREGTRQYAVGGVNAALGGATAQVRALASPQGGFGADVQALRRIGPVRTNMQLGYFSGLESPDLGFDDNATELDAELTTNTPIDFGFTRMNLGVSSRFNRDRGGSTRLSVQSTQRLRIDRLRISNSLDRNLGDNDTGQVDGNLSLSRRFRPIGVRAGVDYALPLAANNARLNLRYDHGRNFSLGVDVRQSFQNDEFTGQADITRRFGPVLLSGTAGWNEDDGISVGLRLNVGFGPTGHGGYEVAEEGVSNDGAVAAEVFLDDDNDGEPDADERRLKGVRFSGDPSATEPTDADGTATLRGFNTLDDQAITIRTRSLRNPFWLPKHEGYRVVPRAGRTPKLTIPVNRTGAVDGTVRIAESEEPIPGIPLKLVDPNGDTVATTTSSYGGFFAFDRLRYGDYELRLGDTDAWTLVQPVELSVDHGSPVASRQTVLVNRASGDGG